MYSEISKKAAIKYMENNFDRIQIRVRKGKKQKIQEMAEKMGYSVNALIEHLIDTEAERQGFDLSVSPTPSQMNKSKKTEQ